MVDIDNNGSESPWKGYIKPVFEEDNSVWDILEKFLAKVITAMQASKQTNTKFSYSKL
jgi:hypothetical protein